MAIKRTKLIVAAAFAALSVGVNALAPLNAAHAADKKADY